VGGIDSSLPESFDPSGQVSSKPGAVHFTAEETVENAFLAIWAQTNPNEVTELLEGFISELPRRENATSLDADEPVPVEPVS
jgi:hypothetical protein